MFYFWYRFVLDNASVIARGAVNLVYRRIEVQLNDYMGKVFEEICTQYLWKLLLKRKMPIGFGTGGELRQFHTNPLCDGDTIILSVTASPVSLRLSAPFSSMQTVRSR